MTDPITQENIDASVSVMLLRMHDKEVLIPKAMVADVLSWKDELYTSSKTANHWKLGEYSWQDWHVPLVCFESLINPNFHREELTKPKVVIVKSFLKGFENEHYALLCRGFPKPLILSEQSLENLHVDGKHDWIEYSISIGSRVLDVPDFISLQNAVWTMSDVAVSA